MIKKNQSEDIEKEIKGIRKKLGKLLVKNKYAETKEVSHSLAIHITV